MLRKFFGSIRRWFGRVLSPVPSEWQGAEGNLSQSFDRRQLEDIRLESYRYGGFRL